MHEIVDRCFSLLWHINIIPDKNKYYALASKVAIKQLKFIFPSILLACGVIFNLQSTK